MQVPELDHWEGSWVVTRKATGQVIGEFFDRKLVERFNPEKCLVETIGNYLSRINAQIRAENAAKNDRR